MPDWAIHLAVGAVFGKTFRIRNLHILLLGAILPDISAILGTLSDCNFISIDPYFVVSFIVPLGSPFGVACLSLCLACLMNKPFPAFGLMLTGAFLHYLLDILQIGHVEILFYPFNFRVVNLPIFNYGDTIFGWISLIAFCLLATLRFFPMQRDIRFNARHAWLGILPVALLAGVIIINEPRMLEENDFDLKFLLNEPVPENAPVKIYSGKVVQSSPLTVKKIRREVEVVWPETIPEGKLVFVTGRFSGNRIMADSVIKMATGRKMIFSFLTALLMVLYWLKIPGLDRKETANTNDGG